MLNNCIYRDNARKLQKAIAEANGLSAAADLVEKSHAMGIGLCLRKPRTVGQSLSGISVPYLHFLQSSLLLAALYIARPIAVLSAIVLVRMTDYQLRSFGPNQTAIAALETPNG